MRTLLPIEGEKGMVRDAGTHAILAVDKSALARHRMARAKLEAKDDKINNLNERISKLESVIQELIDINNRIENAGINNN